MGIANQIEYVALQYLDERFKPQAGRDSDPQATLQGKLELIEYCKALLIDEDQQIHIDQRSSQILFLNLYAITLSSLQTALGYLYTIVSVLVTYLVYYLTLKS